MPTINHVMVASDLSDQSKAALQRGAQLREQLGARLTLLHVLDANLPTRRIERRRQEARCVLEEHINAVFGSEPCRLSGRRNRNVAPVADDRIRSALMRPSKRTPFDVDQGSSGRGVLDCYMQTNREMRVMPAETRRTSAVAPLNWWNPAMAWNTTWNAKLHANFIAFSDEWQTFMRRRMSEDFRLLQRVGTAANAEQLIGIYGEFWQQAAQDYAHEYAAIAKLVGPCIRSDKAATQSSGVASEPPTHLSKAA